MRFDCEYFVLTPQDRRDVEEYCIAFSADIDWGDEPDDLLLAQQTTGFPLSNSFYIHEREELRAKQLAGYDPFSQSIRDISHQAHQTAHSVAIRAEAHYMKSVAKRRGLFIPIPVLLMYSPMVDPFTLNDDINYYRRFNHGSLPRNIANFIATEGVFTFDHEENPVSYEMAEKVKGFYYDLLDKEPQYNVFERYW